MYLLVYNVFLPAYKNVVSVTVKQSLIKDKYAICDYNSMFENQPRH